MEQVTNKDLEKQGQIISQAEYHMEALERLECDMSKPYVWLVDQIQEYNRIKAIVETK